MVERIERETLHDKVYQSIKNSIVRNEFMPGDELTIDSLASDLGVSPTPVREALAKLSAQGLVVSTQNKKARVAGITKDDVVEIYEVRKLLEPYATRIAAEEIGGDPGLARRLEELRDRARRIGESLAEGEMDEHLFERYMDVDLGLEDLVEEALGDMLLSKVLGVIGDHSLRVRTFTEVSDGDKTAEKNNEEHIEIISRMLSGESEEIEGAVKAHLDNAEERTVEALAE